ncbi:MAG TPA: neutral zinc metallopeptidase [Acidimicrobiales bacterium]|nr:neutral zinc metallopeptidase [Acidimicrobiales bacterium]
MRFRDSARLDASQVSDRRGMGPIAIGGGGGIIGLIVLVVTLLSGGGGGNGLQVGGQSSGADLSGQCTSGADANQREDCRIVGVVNSVQAFWGAKLPGYRPAGTVFFDGSVSTGCGTASSAVGPFYCPSDQHVYIDLGLYDELRNRFGARGGPFAEAYVIAHEYGHHVENLTGVIGRGASGATGPQSAGVRLELQADCLAGMWARGAVATGFIEDLSDDDINDGLDAAASIGDDRIQQQVQGQVNPESWTHGSSEQRQRWFRTGYHSDDRSACDTFAVPTV